MRMTAGLKAWDSEHLGNKKALCQIGKPARCMRQQGWYKEQQALAGQH